MQVEHVHVRNASQLTSVNTAELRRDGRGFLHDEVHRIHSRHQHRSKDDEGLSFTRTFVNRDDQADVLTNSCVTR
jgi:hypothetical protein